MQLDRDTTPDGRGKYALINLRKLPESPRDTEHLIEMLKLHPGAVEWGRKGDVDEFFVMKLRDRHSHPALRAYAKDAAIFDADYASAVSGLADRAGINHAQCKLPD